MKVLELSYLNRPYDGGLFAPTYPEYSRDILPIMIEILNTNNLNFDYHQTKKEWRFPWSKGVLTGITCEKRIRGPNLAYAAINEPGLTTYERYKEILGRVRIKAAKFPQVALAGTPEGRSNWLYEHFVEENKGRIIYGDTRNNPFISDDYVKNLQDNYDSIMLQSYLEGKFVRLTGRPFYYAFTREKNCDKTIKYDPMLQVHIGIDFNVDYMSATLWHCDDTTARCFDEIVLPQNQDTHKMVNAIKARGHAPNRCTVYPDTAGKHRDTRGNFTDITILKNAGFTKCRYRPRAPLFRTRQLSVNNLLDKKRLLINPDRCKALLKDLEDVEQDVGDYSKLKTNPKLTHTSDGMDYMVDILFPLSGAKPIYTTRR